jgi:putative SbcD/Mre11-related phosphoesterase
MQKKILPNAEILGLGLLFPKSKALVIADLHLGYEEMLNRQGTLVPRINFSEIKKRLEETLFGRKLDKIIICGDLKHEFGTISEQEWREVLDILDLLQKHCKKIILVRGNHDNILGPIAAWQGIEILKDGFYLKKENCFVCHGDKIPKTKQFASAKTVVIGHEHPAIEIRDGVKREAFKCFLKGKWHGKTIIVLPSLNAVSTGTIVQREKLLSPFLAQNLSEFEAWAVEDKAYYFGKLKSLE